MSGKSAARDRSDRPSGAYSQTASDRAPRKPAESGPVRRVSGTRVTDDRQALRDGVTQALAQRRYDDALKQIARLSGLEPADPRWPHKQGDVLRTLGRVRDAAAAFRRAAERYEAMGFPVRASAMQRLADELDGPPRGAMTAPPPPHRSIR